MLIKDDKLKVAYYYKKAMYFKNNKNEIKYVEYINKANELIKKIESNVRSK